jgi:nucleoside-diphosphate-sugar epimerase
MAIENVALIGASGTLGPSILEALRAHPTFIPHVLNRHSSKSVYPRTHVITIPDDLNTTDVTKLLKGKEIDALVIAIAGSHVEEQKKLIDAAFEAGVKRVIPAEFGSCDSADEETNQVLPLMEGKKRVREYLIDISAREREGGAGKLTWTSLVTGHFFDWGLGNGLLKFDVKKRKAYLLDGGDIKFSASSLGFIADAVVKVLEKEEETKNKLLYVHSLHVTQKEVLKELERATGEKWETIDEDASKTIAELRPKMLQRDLEAREEIVAVQGIVAADWTTRDAFANSMLGLREENLSEVIDRALGGRK